MVFNGLWLKDTLGGKKIMEDKAFWEQFRQVIREELAVALGLKAEQAAAPEAEAKELQLVSIKELCSHLKLSKQTLYNWLNDKNVNWLLEPCRKKMAGRVSYHIAGIKKAIKEYPHLFSGGRDYSFRDEAILTDEQKLKKRYGTIKANLYFNEPVSKEDLQWYEQESKREEETRWRSF